jgi:hypothetical protein
MQMSSAKVFIFVEGKTDRYFYNKICEAFFLTRGIQYEICLAQELPKLTGGKTALLEFFKYLAKVSSLLDDFKGRKTAAIFYLDKDVDDILRKCKPSEHIVYTQHYCVENYFFAQGDLVEAVAAAASLDISDVRRGLGASSRAWRRNAAEAWKDWVKLCVFCRKLNINIDCNYGVNSSRINNGPYAPIDTVAYSARILELERRSGLTSRGFKLSFGSVSRDVDKLYRDNKFDSVFKGKWYSLFLAEDARRIAGGAANPAALPEKLMTSLQLTIDFNASWVTYFQQPLEEIVRKLL